MGYEKEVVFFDCLCCVVILYSFFFKFIVVLIGILKEEINFLVFNKEF